MHFSPAVALFLALAPSCLLAAPTKTAPEDIQRRWGTGRAESDDDDSSSSYTISSVSGVWQEASSCDLSSVTMPLDQAPSPSPLPGPSSGLVLSHVAVGRGTQNYTCSGASASSTPTAKGAVATLFNATCQAARTPDLLYQTPSIALAYSVPDAESALQAYDILMSGHHYFTTDTTPFFNLDTQEHSYGTVACKKNSAANAPAANGTSPLKSNYAAGTTGTENGDVPWLKLDAVQDESGYTWKEVYRLNTAGGQAPKTCDGIDGDFTVEYAATYWFYTEPGKDGYLNGAVAGTPDGMDGN